MNPFVASASTESSASEPQAKVRLRNNDGQAFKPDGFMERRSIYGAAMSEMMRRPTKGQTRSAHTTLSLPRQ
jgi:hypothetical protein